MCNPRKRSRPAADWTLTFIETTALRNVVEAAAAVMQRVTFKVAKVGSCYFLMVDGADVGYTCCVSARLQLHKVEFVAEELDEFTFCVDCKQILYSIETPSASHCSLVVEGRVEDASICIRLLNPDVKSHEDASRLSTYVDADETCSLASIDFKINIEIDLVKLKEIIKKGRRARAEFLGIKIHNCVLRGKELSLVVFQVAGDTEHEMFFMHESPTDEDGSRVVRAVADGDEPLMEEVEDAVFDAKYPIEKIDAFVRTLSTRMVMAKVMEGMPLMLTHNLGPTDEESSYIRFLIAPSTEQN